MISRPFILLVTLTGLVGCKLKSGSEPGVKDTSRNQGAARVPNDSTSSSKQVAPEAPPSSLQPPNDLRASSPKLLDPCHIRPESLFVKQQTPKRANEHVSFVQLVLTDAKRAAEVNGTLEAMVRPAIDAFRDASSANTARNTLTIDCKASVARGALLSVGCLTKTYTGGAHPSVGFVTRNLWLCDGANLTIDDLCDSEISCRGALKRLVEAQLTREGQDDVAAMVFDECQECVTHPLDVFQIMTDGIRFSFHAQLGHALVDKYGFIDLKFAELDDLFQKAHNYSLIRAAAGNR